MSSTAQDYARKAVAEWTSLPEASPKVGDVAAWVMATIDLFCTIWDDPHWDGWVQLTFRDGELTYVPVIMGGKKVGHRRYRALGG